MWCESPRKNISPQCKYGINIIDMASCCTRQILKILYTSNLVD